jgi:hypothetical protein
MSSEDHDAILRLGEKVDNLCKKLDEFIDKGGARCASHSAQIKAVWGLGGAALAWVVSKLGV